MVFCFLICLLVCGIFLNYQNATYYLLQNHSACDASFPQSNISCSFCREVLSMNCALVNTTVAYLVIISIFPITHVLLVFEICLSQEL